MKKILQNMINPRIEHIESELDRLAFECISVNVFIRQVKILTKHCKGNAHCYVQGNHHLDELIILYSYVHQHMDYLFENNNFSVINALIASADKLLIQVMELNSDPGTDELACPDYIRDMAEKIFTLSRDHLQNKLSDRVI